MNNCGGGVGLAAPLPGRFMNRPYGDVGVRCDAGYTYSGIRCRWFVTSPGVKGAPRPLWIPACAGMTKWGAGTTKWGAGMTSAWIRGSHSFLASALILAAS